ncbi:HTTM domain-containing protein [Thalassoroseus pseudoceratinae]|uniref:HTTM domain-containing protein n=1 Tax=Thalassoroseus pseudoceratinae TaxID=2713176 RepID=UPI001421E577|nr:HTTM domain-containing protein [Thalassoroseus pseudoceratinae]
MMRAFRNYLAQVVEQWDRFFFTPVDPALLGVIRIATGLMLVYTHVIWGTDLAAFFGESAWLDGELIRQTQTENYKFSFWWFVPVDAIHLVHWTCIAVLVLFTLGVWSRITAVLSFLIVVSYAYRVPVALFGLDQINAMLTMYLMVGPCGARYSIDRWWKDRRTDQSEIEKQSEPQPSVTANIALRLIQIHMCVIYFFAGVGKLRGYSWWAGDAMWQAFANLEYQSRDMTWLAHYPKLIDLMTHTTVLWEITFCMLVWRPMARPIMLILGVLLHFGIGAFMGMWTFALIMMVGLSSFLPTDAVARAMSNLTNRNRHAATTSERGPSPSLAKVP